MNDHSKDLKQVFLINTDLKMGAGKAAAQVGHGTVVYVEYIHNIQHLQLLLNDDRLIESAVDIYNKWRRPEVKPIGVMKKIVLKASRKQINDILVKLSSQNIWHKAIYDIGLTQVPEGSLTCVVIEPLSEDKCNMLFGDLKLL